MRVPLTRMGINMARREAGVSNLNSKRCASLLFAQGHHRQERKQDWRNNSKNSKNSGWNLVNVLATGGSWIGFQWLSGPDDAQQSKTGSGTRHYTSAEDYWQDNPRSGKWADKPGINPYGDRLWREKFKNFGYGEPMPDEGIF